jgi:hypothetical protein
MFKVQLFCLVCKVLRAEFRPSSDFDASRSHENPRQAATQVRVADEFTRVLRKVLQIVHKYRL